MSLADRMLAAPEQPEPVTRNRSDAPGYYEWSGDSGHLNTPVVAERPTTWDAYIVEAGLDPLEVEVQEPVSVRGWQVQQKAEDGSTSLVYAHYYRLNLTRRRPGPNITDLLARVKKAKPAKPPKGTSDAALVIALGDLQLGKCDGDGVAGTVDRTMACLGAAALRAKVHNGPVHLALLGDCVEGFTSQGGANAWRTVLTMTEQIRLFRRIILHAVELLAPVTDTLTIAAVPGNHGETVRFAGKGITRYDDSHDTESLHAVADALALNPAAYGHVRCYTPAKDELTVTLDVAGTKIGHAHGHSWRNGKQFEWWSGQSFGDHQVGQADLLLAGHNHHLLVEQQSRRTFVQVPALESESTWWRHRTGQSGKPGIVTLTTRDGSITDLSVV
ncbi:MAG: hypothetical protein NVSMB4_08760 [Acidimicrobiales bacterium]